MIGVAATKQGEMLGVVTEASEGGSQYTCAYLSCLFGFWPHLLILESPRRESWELERLLATAPALRVNESGTLFLVS